MKWKEEPARFWERCLITDEKMWELHAGGVNRQNTRMRAASASEVPPMEKDQYPQKVHVWGGISANGLSELIFLEHSVDGNAYRKLLSNQMQNIKTLFPVWELMIFEDDWAHAHTAKESIAFKEQNFPNFFRTRLVDQENHFFAPSKMDDLWPIERIWRHLVNIVFSKWPLPGTVAEWKSRIQDAWDSVSTELCIRLIHEIPARLHEISRNQGKKIHPTWRSKNSEHRCRCSVCCDDDDEEFEMMLLELNDDLDC